jgi:spore germination cell wall hydrolase CwlJ-like protein
MLGESITIDPTIEPPIEPLEEPSEEPSEEPTPEETPIATTQPEETPPPITVEECVKDFVVEADAYYNDMGYSNNHYEYTEDDVYMLAQIIDIEARGESREGKVAVGNVVMNRVLNRHQFPDTIAGVITAPGQFAWKPDRSPSSSSKRAARLVLQDEYWVIPQDVYYFKSHATAGADWGSHKYYTQIGGHCFYTHNYSGRNRGGEAPPKLFDRTFKYAQYGCKPEQRVKRIQYMLNKLGFDVTADKYFGKGTVDALKVFQESNGLEADGVAGPTTVETLIEQFGLNNYYEAFLAE